MSEPHAGGSASTASPEKGRGKLTVFVAAAPGAGFRPWTGRWVGDRPPPGPGVRVDSGVEEDASIGVHYDPMIAKLIVRAADREQGLDRMARALREQYHPGGKARNFKGPKQNNKPTAADEPN